MKTRTQASRQVSIALLLIATSFSLQLNAQTFCDSVIIEHVRYNALNPGMIEVSAMSISPNNCFGYPTFVLYDQSGDTLAREPFGFFCLGLGNLQSHMMNVLPGAMIPNGPFPGTLELFSGNGNTLVCSWQMNFDLCPSDSCVQAEIYLTDMHAQLGQGSVYWQLYDSSGTQSYSGMIQMDGINHTHFDTLCLPPGVFDLFLSPFSSINVFDSIVLGITTSYQQSIGINTAMLNDSTPYDLSFRWYEECVDLTNSVHELETTSFHTIQDGTSLLIIPEEGSNLQQVQLLDLRGQTVASNSVKGDRITMPIGTLSKGLYIVRALNKYGAYSSQKVIIQ